MTQKGTHTWDIVVQYHRCPKCGFIIESRQGYTYRLGKYQKEVSCERCGFEFTANKPSHPTFGPLIGDPQPPEVTWE